MMEIICFSANVRQCITYSVVHLQFYFKYFCSLILCCFLARQEGSGKTYVSLGLICANVEFFIEK